MQILLHKIRKTKSQFDVKIDQVSYNGCFWRNKKHSVKVEGKIQGDVALVCDRCGEQFLKNIDEQLCVEVINQPLKVTDCLDVIECLDGVVDFDMICKSEIASIQSGYHLCKKCKDVDGLEVEY